MTPREKIRKELQTVVQKLYPNISVDSVVLEYPQHARFGHFASNCALQLAKSLKRNPYDVAQEIAKGLGSSGLYSAQAVSPGYINFTLLDSWLLKIPKVVKEKKLHWSENKTGRGKRVNIEFISANPTGPLTLANGRGGFLGDVLANVLTKSGFNVTREYYVNDAGNQVNILAESVLRKYFIKQGIPMEFPEYCYQGDYIDELVLSLHIPNYNIAKNNFAVIRDKIKDRLIANMLKKIQKSIKEKMHIRFDKFYSEKKLYAPHGPVEKTLQLLTEKKLTYDKDGALWLATSKFGDEKDRVLKKQNGELTYFLPDLSYHLEKFEKRKFDHVIDIFGADHHGYVGRMSAAMKMFGHNDGLTTIIMQFIRLIQDGQEVKMSKRKGTYITTEEVIDDVGLDAVRYFFLLYSPNTHMDFDLRIAKERSEKNPVYYVQYAHARICSILKTVKEKGGRIDRKATVGLKGKRLIAEMLKWPDLVEDVSKSYSVQNIPQYAYAFARSFHDFYDSERVLGLDGTVNEKLLTVVESAKIIFADVLSVMGISAPTSMK